MANKSKGTNSWPHVSKLESIAMQAKTISSTIRVDVPEGYVLMEFISHGPADVAQVKAGYSFYYAPAYTGSTPVLAEKPGRSTSSIGQQQGSENYMWHDKSIANSLQLLVKDWDTGTPDFDSIKIATKSSPVEGAELEQLMLAVWLEVFGHKVPEVNALGDRVRRAQQKHKELRARCFEWLQKGSRGVKKWNNLRVDEREAVGKLGKCHFRGCDLHGAYFGNQDLRGSDFREANLRGARFGGADCRDSVFRGANLSDAWLSGGKFLQADFSNASFRNATIRAADCRSAIFSGADLRGVDFSFADLRNVDLSNTVLDGSTLFRVKYDELTKFPPSFVAEPELRMEFKGAVKRESEYRSNCSLEELLTLIPPPPSPSFAEGDWDEAEAKMGIRFPSDFKQLINAYGSGELLSGLRIYNPLTEDGRKSITEDRETLEESREACEYLWPIHPEESGMLPWGHDSNGNFFCWLARGEPDNWPTAQLGHDADEPESDNVNITTFLINYARNQYPEMLGGLRFEESNYRFSPT
jgi:hypothetical protein